MEKEILRDAFPECTRLSHMINLGMKKYYNDKWSLLGLRFRKRYMQAYNLLGDPSLFYKRDCIENIEITSSTEFNSGEIITYYTSINFITPKGNVSVAVNPESNMTFIIGNTILLKLGFSAKSTSYFRARIVDFYSASNLKSTLQSDETGVMALSENNLIEDQSHTAANDIKVFSNPVKEDLRLYINLGKSLEFQVEIYNTLGKLLYSTKYNVSYVSINLADYPSDIYILNVNKNGSIYKQKIIKE